MTVYYVNPVADCLVAAKPYTLAADLTRSATLGLVINSIVDCDTFMQLVGEEILALRPGLTIKPYPTGTITFADRTLIERVAHECDAAVCAIGHCGSCTAGTIKDGIALVEAGCPAVSLVTELFWDQAEALARSHGWASAPRVQLPYPIWGSGSDSMRAVAHDIAPAIVTALEHASEHAA